MQRKLVVTTVEEILEAPDATNLTRRELEVLMLSCRMTNKEIAHQMRVSQQTIKNHFMSIQQKLRTGTRTESVVQAIGMGILEVEVKIAKSFAGTLTG